MVGEIWSGHPNVSNETQRGYCSIDHYQICSVGHNSLEFSRKFATLVGISYPRVIELY